MDRADSQEDPGSDEDLPERRITVNQLIAWNMAYFRKAAGMTQQQLGEQLGGWSNAAVSAAERSWDGKRVRQFDADAVVAIAKAVGIPVTGMFLPPDDAGISVRYLLDGPSKEDVPFDLTSLFMFAPTAAGAFAAYRARLPAVNALQRETGQLPALLGKARARAEDLEREAVLEELVAACEEFERRIDDLRAFEREYHSRLKVHIEDQMRVLEDQMRVLEGRDPMKDGST